MPEFEPLSPPRTVGDLLARTPVQFGLRGDVYLWEELREQLAGVPLPDTRWELATTLRAAYADALGRPLDDSETSVYVARFDPGRGMSAGHVLPAWWHRTGIPILIDRYCAFSGEY